MVPKKAKRVKADGLEISRTEPIKMTFGFALYVIRTCGKLTGPLTAKSVAAVTAKEPKLFPRPWTLEEAQYALDHVDDLIEVVGKETKP